MVFGYLSAKNGLLYKVVQYGDDRLSRVMLAYNGCPFFLSSSSGATVASVFSAC